MLGQDSRTTCLGQAWRSRKGKDPKTPTEEGAHAESSSGEGIELMDRLGEEGFIAREGEEGKEESEEFGHRGEGA